LERRGEEEVARRKKMLTIGVCSSVHERGRVEWVDYK